MLTQYSFSWHGGESLEHSSTSGITSQVESNDFGRVTMLFFFFFFYTDAGFLLILFPTILALVAVLVGCPAAAGLAGGMAF